MIESHFVVSLASNFTATLLSQLFQLWSQLPTSGDSRLEPLGPVYSFVKSLIAMEKY